MDAKKVFGQVMLERHTNYEEMASKSGMVCIAFWYVR